jgi:hypothetical protein
MESRSFPYTGSRLQIPGGQILNNENPDVANVRTENITAEHFTYRGLTARVWRTDDPMEPPEDDPEAEGPFETGDWYFAIEEWRLQSDTSKATFGLALRAAESAIDTALESGVTPRAGDPDWFSYP